MDAPGGPRSLADGMWRIFQQMWRCIQDGEVLDGDSWRSLLNGFGHLKREMESDMTENDDYPPWNLRVRP